jgi:hypothetical protein
MRVTTNHPLSVSVSCDDCVRHSTPECEDCLVSFVLGDTPDHLSLSEEMAVAASVLVSEGLLPELKYRPGGSLASH